MKPDNTLSVAAPLLKFGRVFVGYAFAEGWAHYAEEMMLEAGTIVVMSAGNKMPSPGVAGEVRCNSPS